MKQTLLIYLEMGLIRNGSSLAIKKSGEQRTAEEDKFEQQELVLGTLISDVETTSPISTCEKPFSTVAVSRLQYKAADDKSTAFK